MSATYFLAHYFSNGMIHFVPNCELYNHINQTLEDWLLEKFNQSKTFPGENKTQIKTNHTIWNGLKDQAGKWRKKLLHINFCLRSFVLFGDVFGKVLFQGI